MATMYDESSTSSAAVTIKAVYCPGSTQEEIRRFSFPLPGAAPADVDDHQPHLYDELRKRIGATCTGAGSGDGLSLYYVDADNERVRFSTSEELAQLLRLHHSSGGDADPRTLRILAEPASSEADGCEHPGVRCDGCNQAVRGRRFRCFACPDYDLCQRCVLRGVHDQHSMLVLHRPGDADSLPPWLCRVGGGFGRGGGGFGRGGGGFGRGGGGGGSWQWGHHFPWQQQTQCQQQQQQQSTGFPFARPPMPPHMPPFMMPHHPLQQQQQQQPPPPFPMSVACPKLAKKLEKARCKFEAKMAKRCDRLQRKWAHRQQMKLLCQQQKPQRDSAAGTAEEPIRIDMEEQQALQCQQQQPQEEQQISPEEALLLKQLQKRHKQSSASAKKKRAKHRHHHKKGRGGRKRRRSRSSSSSSSDSSGGSSSDDDGASSSSGSSSESDCDDSADKKAYRQLLKRFKKMGFKDDETCWLRELIRAKRGNLNEILDAIRQRKDGGKDV